MCFVHLFNLTHFASNVQIFNFIFVTNCLCSGGLLGYELKINLWKRYDLICFGTHFVTCDWKLWFMLIDESSGFRACNVTLRPRRWLHCDLRRCGSQCNPMLSWCKQATYLSHRAPSFPIRACRERKGNQSIRVSACSDCLRSPLLRWKEDSKR